MQIDLRTGKHSIEDAISDTVKRCQQSQPTLNAFVRIDRDGALAAARTVDASGAAAGPLAGVPVSVKDILNVCGLPTNWGSRLMQDADPAAADTIAVARLRKAGAIIIGKSTTTEFAHTMMGSSPLTGLTINPWNPAATCGGSSCGGGVSVAAGLVRLALTTDAGASTRLPAACTGVLGLKPTLGRIPHDLVPEGFANFIHLGMITRSVADMALALETVAGPAPSDPHSLGLPRFDASEVGAEEGNFAGKRIGLIMRVGNARISRAMTETIRSVATTLSGYGASVTEIEWTTENPEPTWRILQQSNWAARLGKIIDEVEDKIEPSLAEGVRVGLSYSGQDLQGALNKRTALFRHVQKLFDGFDFLLTPVMSQEPLDALHKPLDPIIIDGEVVGDMRREWTPYLSLFDLTGHPAISVPAGLSDSGVPLAFQLVAPWYEEAKLLGAVAFHEQHHPWQLLDAR
ncbi:amidase [Bradyrhizobium neotropicale]|uniref:amidase n=1 Tax=Bradyrhizobium neotropicale TaxID=1497615 RepID=UPI001AD7C310|nr:amidase family protein [Bradyrhizobium neotropicale]MBO4221751.1 amidase [Bradyrhizobium neotropicale]